ncbi:Peptide chain release factor class I/class II [Penicillium cf. griseofulvum]|uniref:Peptide chain release factor class I/class II n=1 Tax=Penicillium cf. griseofulvum TaxID=2972120 RepID=A0A9W9MQ40_9EURO|nr:Peptide chain release factor class I/class II [Penicillium cf. griseofulvum]KAJ5437370.1 Peptide chain release factor class I/class II [Penicillium cf. griseofulvum]
MLRLHWWTSPRIVAAPVRLFSQTPIVPAKPLPPRLKINDADISISYLKGTGPGGQKINKTNSAVQIIHRPSGVVVKCQATRSQSQNAKIARSLLADKVEAQEKGDKSRVAIKAAAAKKKKASKMKKTRRKYRELGEGGKVVEEEEDEVEIIWDEDVKEDVKGDVKEEKSTEATSEVGDESKSSSGDKAV